MITAPESRGQTQIPFPTWMDFLHIHDPFCYPSKVIVKCKALKIINTSDKGPHPPRKAGLFVLFFTSGNYVSYNYCKSLALPPALFPRQNLFELTPYT
jgi:hypothetical protein